MDALQHKQHLMAIIASSLIPNRKTERGTEFNRYNVSYKDMTDLAQDAEKIVDVILQVSEKSKLENSEHNDY